MKKEIENLMLALDITEEEAVELLKFDSEEVENEEVEKLTQKAKKVETPVKRGRKPKSENSTGMAGVTTQTRKKKENPTKKAIVESLAKALENVEGAVEIDIKNPEKTIYFKIGQDTFEIDLKQKRKIKE